MHFCPLGQAVHSFNLNKCLTEIKPAVLCSEHPGLSLSKLLGVVI